MNKKTLLFFLSALCLFGAWSVKAEDEGEEEETSAEEQIATTPAELTVIEGDTINNILNNAIGEGGLDGEKFILGKDVQKIGQDASSPNYPLALQSAYEMAWENAIAKIVEEIESELAKSVQTGKLSASNGLTKADLDPKVAQMLNDAIAKELQKQNVDLNDPEAVKAALPKVADSQSMKSAISSASKMYISGIVAYKTVIRDGEIGVLAYYSPAMKKLSDCMAVGEKFEKLPKGQKIFQIWKKIPLNELSMTFGPRCYIDQKGDPVIVAFAQERIVGSHSTAEDSAILSAKGFIRDFMGTAVAVSRTKETASDIATLEDQMGNTQTVSNVMSKFKSEGKREGEKMSFNGIKTYSKDIVLPSGHKCVVVIAFWSPTTAMHAKQAKALNSTKPKKSIKSKPAPTSNPKFQNRSVEGEGASGIVF